ncbi:hypothetical protein C8R46DRAFT_1223592 [Mycena filopes]|nr:hypothetical protein C8R46DRAFT_1223592 [Mycena filopes]
MFLRVCEARPHWMLVGRTFRPFLFVRLPTSHVRHQCPGLSQEDMILNGKTPCYIVGFSDARAKHICKCKLPVLPLGSFIPSARPGAPKLAQCCLCCSSWMISKRPSRRPRSSLEWHDEYTRCYPKTNPVDLLLAQRVKLFPDARLLYPGLVEVSSAGDELYSEAIFTQYGDGADETTDEDDAVLDDECCASPEPVEAIVGELQRVQLEDAGVELKFGPGRGVTARS